MNRVQAFGTAAVSIVLGGVVLAGAGFALASASPHQSPLHCTSTGPSACTLTVSTFPDSLAGMHGSGGGPHPDWVSYSNDNLVVPANTTVTMVIDQYDSGGALNNEKFFGKVWGTVGGTATITTPGSGTQTVTHVDPTNIGHTFTLRGIAGNGSPIFVSVPLPANPSSAASVKIGDGGYPPPVVVKFSFKTGSKGVYEFNCEFPCGGSRQGQFGEAMSSYGYMSGTVTVQ